jgi:hypothetical protein
MIPNPAWSESEEAKLIKQLTIDDMVRRRECPEDAFPEEYGKEIPADGAWILLLSTVTVGRMVGETTQVISVPRLSMWFAKPHTSNARVLLHDLGIKRRKDRQYTHLHQAVINTPDGAVHVWPHEFTKIDIGGFLEFCDDDGLFIHYLSDEAHIDKSALFYLRSRGISKADAQRMLLGTLRNSNYCYFTLAPEIMEAFDEGTGSPYLYPVNHARRAQSIKMRTGPRDDR